MAGMRPLRRRVIEDMTVRNLSPATNDRMYMLLPGSAASSGVRLTSVISRTCERSRFIWSLAGYQPALNQTVCARIASGFTLKQTDLPERIPYGREPRRWPVVLGADEVVRFPGSGAQPKGACRADYGLCGRTARVGSSEPQGRQLSGARSSASDKWRNMAVNLPRQVAGRSGCDGTLWPEMNGIAGFALSHWQHKRDNIGTGWDVFMPAAMFAAALRRWQGWEYSAKEKVPMYSPTLFAAELEPIEESGQRQRLDHARHHPRHRAQHEQPRGIPRHLSRASDGALQQLQPHRGEPALSHLHPDDPLRHAADQRGDRLDHRQGSERPHGLDTSKFDGTSMFHRPNHRPEMFLTEYLTDRQPLNPYQWIDQAPLEAWLAAKMIEAVPQSAPSEELTSPAKHARAQSRQDRGSRQTFRTTGFGQGTGRPKLYGLYKRSLRHWLQRLRGQHDHV